MLHWPARATAGHPAAALHLGRTHRKGASVLFNTLEYARFFAIVFLASWLLVDRRFALFLPWLGVVGYAAGHPSLHSAGLAAGSGAFTWALFRLSPRPSQNEATPAVPWRLALASSLLSLVALSFLTFKHHDIDPISYGLSRLGVPIARLHAGKWLLFAIGSVASFLLICARKVRLLFLLGASYFFYAHWDYRFLPLIWASSTADWLLARAIHRARGPKSRRLWLVGTMIMNLGVLGFFKYANFGMAQLSAAMTALGFEAPDFALHIALPVGISFFTFESMSYVIDVYRGELEPQKSYAEYLSFVAFFPHLVAGPIIRPKDLLPQLAGPARFNPAEASEGIFLIAMGLGKKILIGDYLALNLIDRVFDSPAFYSALEVYAAVLGYALQIYCDFSGYTDIAIGSALLLGVRFPKNFDSPYKSASIVEFWRRWHISLSTWLRDYLYIPLGGNRRGRLRTYINLLITMVLGGLWHGAAWTFVVWGTMHGLALAANKWWQERRAASRPRLTGIRHFVAVFATFHFVCACWVFFRSSSFDRAWLIFERLASLSFHHENLPPSVVAVLALGLIGHYVPDNLFQRGQRTFVRLPAAAQGTLLFLLAVALRRMASADAVPFVYFQF